MSLTTFGENEFFLTFILLSEMDEEGMSDAVTGLYFLKEYMPDDIPWWLRSICESMDKNDPEVDGGFILDDGGRPSEAMLRATAGLVVQLANQVVNRQDIARFFSAIGDAMRNAYSG